MAVKRRPAVVLSSEIYHSSRPDIVVGLLTSRIAGPVGPTDYVLKDWQAAGLKVASAFRSFFATLPLATHPARVGRLSERDWLGVCAAVRSALAPLASPPRLMPE